MVTKEEFEMFCRQLKAQSNIYDLLVLLYAQIDGVNKPQL